MEGYNVAMWFPQTDVTKATRNIKTKQKKHSFHDLQSNFRTTLKERCRISGWQSTYKGQIVTDYVLEERWMPW